MYTIGETVFHKGDRVIVVADCIDRNIHVRRGLTGTVCSDRLDCGRVRIQWDCYVHGHDCSGACKNGYGWNALPNEIKHLRSEALVEEETDEITVKEDDLMSFLFT